MNSVRSGRLEMLAERLRYDLRLRHAPLKRFPSKRFIQIRGQSEIGSLSFRHVSLCYCFRVGMSGCHDVSIYHKWFCSQDFFTTRYLNA